MNVFKRPLDLALWAIFIVSLALLFLAHEDPFVREALCSRSGFCPVIANAKAWNKIAYDLAVAALVSLLFYVLIVRVPEHKKRLRFKKSLAHQYRNFRIDCIQLMLAVADGTYDPDLPKELLEQEKFKNYFEEQVTRDQDRWNRFENKLDAYNLKELIKKVEIFRDEIAFVLNNVDIPSEAPFEFLKRLSAVIYSVQDTTLGYDETKPLARFLWEIFAGFSWVSGYRERDIISEMIEAI
jgi:hypothetical protein